MNIIVDFDCNNSSDVVRFSHLVELLYDLDPHFVYGEVSNSPDHHLSLQIGVGEAEECWFQFTDKEEDI